MQNTVTSITSSLPMQDVETMRLATDEVKEEVAKSFEAVFASLLIKQMRNTLSDGLFGSESSDVMGGLFDLHMGQAMTEGAGLGIRDKVLAQLQKDASPKPDSRNDGNENRN